MDSAALAARLKAARLLVLDVDGVLTDGGILYVRGVEAQRFDVHDGQGLRWLIEEGVELVWITGRGSRATETRARELGVRELFTGAGEKGSVLAALQERLSIPAGETVAMGDDLPDLAWLPRCAAFAAPADARSEVRSRAALVTSARGGHGAVRELCEAILSAKGLWNGRAERYARAPG